MPLVGALSQQLPWRLIEQTLPYGASAPGTPDWRTGSPDRKGGSAPGPLAPQPTPGQRGADAIGRGDDAVGQDEHRDRVAQQELQPAFVGPARVVGQFIDQFTAFGALVAAAPPTAEQTEDLDFLLTLGQLFTQVVYGQLV